ncbi:hypothetical protein Tco_0198243, partial [Tanacetum coccineum]
MKLSMKKLEILNKNIKFRGGLLGLKAFLKLILLSTKRTCTELEQESIKKQKLDEDKEIAELQRLIEVVPDKEEVVIDAI